MINAKIQSSLLFGFLFFITTISYSQQPASGDLPVIKVDVAKHEAIPVDTLFKSVKYIPLETKKECQIGYVNKLVMSGKYMLIVDKRNTQLLLFDTTGKFITNIGKKGQDAGEYEELFDAEFGEAGDCIWVWDPAKSAIISFDLQGNFKESVSVGDIRLTGPMFKMLDGKIYFDRLLYGGMDGCYMSSFEFPYMSDMQSFVPVHPTNVMGLGMGEQSHMDIYSRRIAYLPVLSDTIYHVDYTGVIPAYRIDAGNNRVNKEKLAKQKFQNIMEFDSYINKEEAIDRFWILLETDDFIYVDFAFRSIVHSVFYSKASGRSKTVYTIETPKDTKDYYQVNFIAKSNNRFVGITRNNMTEEVKKMKGMEIEEFNNPIVMIYELKPF